MKGPVVQLLLAVLSPLPIAARTFTVYNGCPFTIWPAIFTDLNVGSATPDYPTGWSQDAYQTVQFYVPDNWKAGRIWARRDCDFTVGNPGPASCLDGGCNGGLECDPYTGTGVPPATLAEFTLGTGEADQYAISVVDGTNLPMRITPSDFSCHVSECPVDLGPNCPSELIGPFDSSGFPVGCKSACIAGLGGDPANNPNCCTGYYDNPGTCVPSGVEYYSYFKGNCPNAVAYAFDQAAFICALSCNADYTVTFCP